MKKPDPTRRPAKLPAKPPIKAPTEKAGLHPRSVHRSRYGFGQLVSICPELSRFVIRAPHGGLTVDFAEPDAVRMLNRALLMQHYAIRDWQIPADYLCPPIPGRADSLHHLADLLASCHDGEIPRGKAVRALDIGVGASAIHPLIGQRLYGWSFVGSDIDGRALKAARRILAANPDLAENIELRLQPDSRRIFAGIVQPGECFDLTLCNPPFHASQLEAREGSQRKWRNLGHGKAQTLNFGGQGNELWCPGGELAFIRTMIEESARIPQQCFWFTTLVAKSAHLPALHGALRKAGAVEVRVLDMAQGQKKSRILAWTFLDEAQRLAWRVRWHGGRVGAEAGKACPCDAVPQATSTILESSSGLPFGAGKSARGAAIPNRNPKNQ